MVRCMRFADQMRAAPPPPSGWTSQTHPRPPTPPLAPDGTPDIRLGVGGGVG